MKTALLLTIMILVPAQTRAQESTISPLSVAEAEKWINEVIPSAVRATQSGCEARSRVDVDPKNDHQVLGRIVPCTSPETK